MSCDKVKWRKPVRPGDQLLIKVKLTKVRGTIACAEGECSVGGQVVCSADLMFMPWTAARGLSPMAKQIHPTAIIEPGAELGEDVVVGAYAFVGASVTFIGAGTVSAPPRQRRGVHHGGRLSARSFPSPASAPRRRT